MNVKEAIYARRSVRKYQDRPVEAEKLEELTRLGAAAPSAHNRKPWVFLLANDPDTMERVRTATLFGRFGAPAAIVVCGDKRRMMPLVARDFWVQDCSAAIQNMLLAAVEMGLGAVWLGCWPLKQGSDRLRAHLHLPDHLEPLGTVYLGYPAEEHEPRTQWEDGMTLWLKDLPGGKGE